MYEYYFLQQFNNWAQLPFKLHHDLGFIAIQLIAHQETSNYESCPTALSNTPVILNLLYLPAKSFF